MTQPQSQGNTTNVEPYPLKAILSAPVYTLISEYLVGLLQAYHFADPSIKAGSILAIMRASKTIADAEKAARKVIHTEKFVTTHRAISNSRADLYSGQISPWILGRDVLDLGCGSGLIGVRLEHQRLCNVTFADTVDYLDVNRPFVTLSDRLPFADAAFDTTVISTVLHHSLNAEGILREAARVTRCRLVIKESVIDVSLKQHNASHSLTTKFLALTNDHQFLYTCFVDWFFNRILETGIAVPFMFRSIGHWRQSLNSLGSIESCIDLGIDDSIGALYHVLFVVTLPAKY
jgi:ubiquinone/menaquinone biosynthesis C-methylase UbiE